MIDVRILDIRYHAANLACAEGVLAVHIPLLCPHTDCSLEELFANELRWSIPHIKITTAIDSESARCMILSCKYVCHVLLDAFTNHTHSHILSTHAHTTHMQYFPDRSVQKEINNLDVTCPFAEAGCSWEGKFEEFFNHKSKCEFRPIMTVPDIRVFATNVSPPLSQSLDLNEALSFHNSNMNEQRRYQNPPSVSLRTGLHAVLPLPESMSVDELQSRVRNKFASKLKYQDEEIASLRLQVMKLERQIQSKNSELEDRDFRLSLIENSNHDGTMIWKIPQFNQRKADAENGKYTSIFSLPFYSGRYGYKMCLRLYIMGDGIGKGTHLSLFFVVMRGEFDNILQWPFTHKITFKLISQAGGRDIVDTFQPDPMSISFRKPRSDMNIASGCPRFVSHTELERGGFIVDDIIFIKCTVDTSTICHP